MHGENRSSEGMPSKCAANLQARAAVLQGVLLLHVHIAPVRHLHLPRQRSDLGKWAVVLIVHAQFMCLEWPHIRVRPVAQAAA